MNKRPRLIYFIGCTTKKEKDIINCRVVSVLFCNKAEIRSDDLHVCRHDKHGPQHMNVLIRVGCCLLIGLTARVEIRADSKTNGINRGTSVITLLSKMCT